MRKAAFALVCFLTACGGSEGHQVSSQVPEFGGEAEQLSGGSSADLPRPQQALLDAAAALLRDPQSAQFRNLHWTELPGVCGELNGTNALGGYTGFRRFFVDGSGEEPLVVFDRGDRIEALWQDIEHQHSRMERADELNRRALRLSGDASWELTQQAIELSEEALDEADRLQAEIDSLELQQSVLTSACREYR